MAATKTAGINQGNAGINTVHETGSVWANPGAVSWGAVFAGAAAAAALSLILLILGTGLGLSSISPWADSGASAKTIGISTIAWITFMQLASAGIGGYLAGRLRTKWTAIHGDEVYFRDTAHGFLAWAVATLATAALLTSVIGTIVSGGARAGASMAGGAAASATAAAAGGAVAAGTGVAASDDNDSMAYFVDLLFRKNLDAPAPANATGRGSPDTGSSQSTVTHSAEVARIFINSIRSGTLSPEDARYVSQLVAQRTGMSAQETEKRVTDTFARAQASLREAEVKAKEVADQTRKATAYSALWIFVSLLIGAFVASLTATFGGRQRDA